MSKVQLQGNVSGTGIFTIASPNSNTDRTLTLPDSTGTLLNNAAQGIPKSALPTGSVLQVVYVDVNADAVTTSSTYVDSGKSATITPTSSSSKILVIANFITGNSAPPYRGYIQMRRGTVTAISTTGGQMQNADAAAAPITMICLDSPATTSAVTYKFYYKTEGGNFYIHTFGAGSNGSITLMEIAA